MNEDFGVKKRNGYGEKRERVSYGEEEYNPLYNGDVRVFILEISNFECISTLVS